MTGVQTCALPISVHGPLTIAASLVAEHRLQMHRLSNCGSRAHLLHGMWDLPGPGLEPVSPALAGRLSTTAPPGKPLPFVYSFLSSLLFRAKSLILGFEVCISERAPSEMFLFQPHICVRPDFLHILTHIYAILKKNGSDEPKGRTGIKTQT